MAWTVWMIGSIFYAYQYILRVMPNIMLGDLMHQFNIDATIFGQFSGAYYLGYALCHLPIGILLDRFGPRKVMSACLMLTVIGTLPLLMAEHWIYPILGRTLVGIGSSAAILGTFKIIRMTFAEKRFTRMLSFSVTIGLLGAIYGGGPVSYMTEVLGYQSVIQIFAFIGVALAAATYLIVPEIEVMPKNNIKADVIEVISNPKVITTCLMAGFLLGPLEGFADVWGSEFLKKVYNLDNHVAASLPSMIFIGMCFGAPLLSLIAEKTNNYFGTIIGAGAIMAIAFTALIAEVLTVTTMTPIFILVGICCAYQILSIYKASTYVREEIAGLTTAIANMIIMFFGYTFHSIIGTTIDLMGGTNTPQAFISGIGIIPITLGIGVIGYTVLMIRERTRNLTSAKEVDAKI
jgi:MFS family permease